MSGVSPNVPAGLPPADDEQIQQALTALEQTFEHWSAEVGRALQAIYDQAKRLDERERALIDREAALAAGGRPASELATPTDPAAVAEEPERPAEPPPDPAARRRLHAKALKRLAEREEVETTAAEPDSVAQSEAAPEMAALEDKPPEPAAEPKPVTPKTPAGRKSDAVKVPSLKEALAGPAGLGDEGQLSADVSAGLDPEAGPGSADAGPPTDEDERLLATIDPVVAQKVRIIQRMGSHRRTAAEILSALEAGKTAPAAGSTARKKWWQRGK